MGSPCPRCSQLRQAFAENPTLTALIVAEQFTNRDGQSEGTFCPVQIPQGSFIVAMNPLA